MSKQNVQLDDWDVETYRSPWESAEQWEVRKGFMEMHKESIPEDELVCLAQVYTNTEFLGCRYPDNVSKRVKEMANGLVDDVRQNKRRQETIAFVKTDDDQKKGPKRTSKLELPPAKHRPPSYDRQTDNANSASDFTRPSNRSNAASYFNAPNEVSPSQYNHPAQGGNNYQMQNYYTSNYKSSQEKFGQSLGSGVSSSNRNPSTGDLANSRPPQSTHYRNSANTAGVSGKPNKLQGHFYSISKALLKNLRRITSANLVEMFHKAVGNPKNVKCDITRVRKVFRCELFVKDVFVGCGESADEDVVQRMAYEEALEKFLQTNVVISSESGKLTLAYDASEPRLSKLDNHYELYETPKLIDTATLKEKFSKFLILFSMEQPHLKSVCVLQNSADFNKQKVNYKFYEPTEASGIYRCVVEIQSLVLGNGTAASKGQAKGHAADMALERLREMAFTLAVKRSVLSDGETVSKGDLNVVEGGEESDNKPYDAIPESNLGNKLLRLMGWNGGGLGKPGNEGIVEPIQPQQVIGRQGFGRQHGNGVMGAFRNKAREIISSYARSDSNYDLVFDSEFSLEERAVLHEVANRYKLKNTSRGKGESRYLIVSRRRQPQQVLDLLLGVGGSNERYELIPPPKWPDFQRQFFVKLDAEKNLYVS